MELHYPSPVYSKSRSVEISHQDLMEKKIVCISSSNAVLNHYKILRTQVQQSTRIKGCRTIMITSVGPAEGKTLTAVNLAITMARDFHEKILLVDADLKNQNIHNAMGYYSDKGIAAHLLDDIPLNELIVWPGIDKLTVLSGGSPVESSAELLGSPRMREMVADMKKRYDDRYIIFDVPPLLGCADTINFVPMVDCIIITINSGKTAMKEVNRVLTLLPGEKILGFVMNRHNTTH